ncbi:MAG: peptide deformylase [bacterium]
MVKIVQYNDPVLREETAEVPLDKIGSKEISKIIEDMKVAMDACDDGVAIAAPQIGKKLKIFVVSPKVFIGPDEEIDNEKLKKEKHLIFINPKILKLSTKTVSLDEGCLSVRGIYGKIKRAEKATIEAYDENGNKIVRGASGLLAEVFQHEIDHLNGVLFTDTATGLYEMVNEGDNNKKNENK